MKIFVIAPFNLPIPPYEGYGGTQRIIYDIVKSLKNTDEVTLIAPAGSRELQGLRLITYPSKDKQQNIDAIIDHLKTEKYDLVYSHISSTELAQKVIQQQQKLVVASYYYFDTELLEQFRQLGCCLQSLSYSHGDYLRKYVDDVISVKYSMAYDDITPSLLSLRQADEKALTLDVLKNLKQRNKDYFLIVSRISDYKGQATTIELAKQAGMPLIIAGEPILRDEGDFDYFEQHVKPYIDDENVIYFGNANESERNELMRYAKATILPTGFENQDWHEAYGRVVNESLACGTPVIANDRDAMPEQIEHGVSGFLFKTFDEALTYCKRIDEIDRTACVARVQDYLNIDRFMRDLRTELKTVVDTQ